MTQIVYEYKIECFSLIWFHFIRFEFSFGSVLKRIDIIVDEMRQKLNFSNYLSSFLLFCYLINVLLLYGSQLSNANSDLSDSTDWNQIFSLRNDDDWKQLWHKEKHRRCYQQLILHMEWVCDKDIYKVRRKRNLIEGKN